MFEIIRVGTILCLRCMECRTVWKGVLIYYRDGKPTLDYEYIPVLASYVPGDRLV